MSGLHIGVAKRLKKQGGFSLTELLAVIVVMTLMGVMMATGIPAAQEAYMGAMDRANAESALFTTVERLRNKLSVADFDSTTIGAASGGASEEERIIISYKDENSGYKTSIVQKKNGGLYIRRVSDLPDGNMIGSPEDEPLVPVPLMKGAKEDLVVQFKSSGGIVKNEGEGTFQVTNLEVVRQKDPSSPLAELGSVKIRSVTAD